MRRVVISFLILYSWSVLAAVAGPLPLTVKEISLMLRSGYSSNSVLKELTGRRFADRLDEAQANSLRQAHASDELINALQSGAYSLSPEQSAAVQQQIADQA